MLTCPRCKCWLGLVFDDITRCSYWRCDGCGWRPDVPAKPGGRIAVQSRGQTTNETGAE